MTNEELCQYAGQWVELQLTDGRRIVGKLVTDNSGSHSDTKFEIDQPSAALNENPPRLAIADASLIETVKTIAAPPETFD